MKRPAYTFVILAFVGAVGAGPGCTSAADPVDCSTTKPKPFSELSSAFAYCTSCHGGQRAAAGYRYDTYEDAVNGATAAADTIANGSMPPSEDMPEDLATAVNVWAQCGTPE